MMPVLDVYLQRVDGGPCADGEFMTSGLFGVCDCDGNEVDCESIADALDAVRVAQNVVWESRRQGTENLDDGRLLATNDSRPRWNGVEEILQMMKKNGPCYDARDWLELIRDLEVAVCDLKKEMARRELVLNESLVRKEKGIAAIKEALDSLDVCKEE
ncbi:MAG: hypothetical protein MJZ81_10775 [Bacteroidales bacterium]|nr:hypothetical protein [Bacteroidales bacterium]